MKSPLIPAVLSFAAAAAALPLGSSVPASPDVSVVNAADLDAFVLYAQYAAAAYCNSDAAVGTAVACPATADPSMSTCPALEAAGVAVTAVLRSPATGVEGFVAYDAARRLVVVSFRGSHGLRDVLTDLDLVQTACAGHLSAGLADRIGAACAVHKGFGAAWAALRSMTLSAVLAAMADPGDDAVTLVVTGHSLGGAIATLAAAELRDQGIACALYTFGSPRVGNAVLAAYLSTQQQSAVQSAMQPVGAAGAAGAAAGTAGAAAGTAVAHYRLTHGDDPVPQVPDLDRGYAHTSPEFWLAGPGDTAHAAFRGAVAYRPADVHVCPGYANVSCNAAVPSSDVAAHLSYFEPISGCAPRWTKEDEVV